MLRNPLDNAGFIAYNAGMKMLNLTLLSAVALCTPAMAQEPQPAPAAAEQQADAPLPPAVTEALAAMVRENHDDFYAVAGAVLDNGGLSKLQPYMEQAAAEGSPAAQLWLARLALDKLTAAKADMVNAPTAKEARELVKQAADKGYQPAIIEMSRLAGSGIGAPADEKEGLRLLMEACKAGNARARAAYLLVTGRLDGGKLDAPEIVSELKKNNFYLEEIVASLQNDEAEALKWMKRAAEHGSPRAAYTLFNVGNGLVNDTEARDYLQLAVSRHLPDAVATLGVLQTVGDGTVCPIDTVAGLRRLEESVALGYTPAAVTLASVYQTEPQKYSAETVFSLYKNATELGELRAAVGYGYCLVTGRGCTADVPQGLELLNKLADAGMPYARIALADIYFNGTGVEPNLRRAVDELGAAAGEGLPGTYSLMAALTAMGNAAAPADERRAAVYLKMAEEQGDSEAKAAYESVLTDKAWHFLPLP